jgi:SAM-dependent methyltransferase
MTLNPPGMYVDDRNLRARQRLWECQVPRFDHVSWVLDLAEVSTGTRVLDAGCGNGTYLAGMRQRGAQAFGCDLSVGMLRSVDHPAVFAADVAALPVAQDVVDVVLAGHLLDLVPERAAALRELSRVLRPGGVFVAVTNGARHLGELRGLVEEVVSQDSPGWQWLPPTHEFTAENAGHQLEVVFEAVDIIRPHPVSPVVIREAAVVRDYVASLATHFQHGVDRPWDEVADEVGRRTQLVIDRDGAFTTAGDVVALVCR